MNVYATGKSHSATDGDTGGLIGINPGTVTQSYSAGPVSGIALSLLGGLIGRDVSASGSIDSTYWGTDTSGITNLSQGAASPPNDPGITGLTTAQLQSGLPAGFDPKFWAEDPKINNGLPYLINNPSPQ
jgi:hypothetical protein